MENEKSTLTVLMVEPGKAPYQAAIGADLKSLQQVVGGYIESIAPYDDPVAIVCNEEGKLEQLPFNRGLRDESGNLYDYRRYIENDVYKYLYGYRKGDDGKPEIIPDQAEVVRKIYDLFLSGTPVRGIQEYLNANSVPNINGEPKWARSAIDSILTNEKYCGDVLLQKTYIDDCINKKVKKNTGQSEKLWDEGFLM